MEAGSLGFGDPEVAALALKHQEQPQGFRIGDIEVVAGQNPYPTVRKNAFGRRLQCSQQVRK
jgi:hypothetical protein